ncbi:MAG: hypothetical protein IKW83_08430 [Muribaculaceae bacterium]|nr:hypothetical protein [Muribaculaceae bacterium]
MRKFFLIAIAILLGCASDVDAQSITVIDTDSVPVAYATVTNEQGQLIGATNVNGILDDTKGNGVLCFSHVAYKPITVNVADLTDGVVIMEEERYTLPSVEVKPKELLYMQTYYRVTYIDEEGPIYYRAGVIDNTYEFANRKVKTKSTNISEGQSGFLKFVLNKIAGGMIEDICKIQKESTYQLVGSNNGKWAKVSVAVDSTGRKVIRDSESILGYVDEDMEEGKRITSFDNWLFRKHLDIAKEKNEKKKQKKQTELDKEQENSERSYYEVYRIDEEGRSTISDFVMMQHLSKGVFKRTKKEYILVLESFATETAYIDKKEFKQTRKDNEVDKSYEDMLRYEKAHNIPPLAPHLKAQVEKLFEKKK